jgi:hypothetical protein
MIRRSLLRQALLILGVDLVGMIGCVSRRAADGFSPQVRASDPRSNLSRAEIEDLVAFGEVLVEGRTLGAAEQAYLVEHIEDRARRSSGTLAAYRTMVGTLERLAGGRFASLEIDERIGLVARHRLATSQVWPGEALAPARIPRTRIVHELIRSYYDSAAGWAVVGYQAFPGRCGALTRYTRPED